jgi:hypothetical protein
MSPGVMLANVILTQYLSGCIKKPPGLGIFKLKLSYCNFKAVSGSNDNVDVPAPAAQFAILITPE